MPNQLFGNCSIVKLFLIGLVAELLGACSARIHLFCPQTLLRLIRSRRDQLIYAY